MPPPTLFRTAGPLEFLGESAGHRLLDVGCDLVQIPRAVDYGKTMSFFLGQSQKHLATALVNFQGLAFEPVRTAAVVAPGTLGNTAQADFGGHVDQKRQVRVNSGNGCCLQQLQIGGIDTRLALVDTRRIGVAVAQNPVAALKRRLDGGVDMVRPGGGKQHGLAARPQVLRFPGQEQLADLLRTRGPAGFACDDDRLSMGFQKGLQAGYLGRLARALSAFKGDEMSSHAVFGPAS